jgi:ribosomal-protein-alanine N-acetyltransferase
VSEPSVDLYARLHDFPVLHTERLTLRELREGDVPAAFPLFSDPEAMRYIGKPPHATSDETLAFVERNQRLFPAQEGVGWAMCLRGSDRFIGYAGHWRLMKPHLRSEIGYQMLPEHWGKGLMTEALRAILRFGFEQMGLNSVEAQIDPANTRSRRTLERLGFSQDGLLRESYYFAGEFTDTAVYTLLRRELGAVRDTSAGGRR